MDSGKEASEKPLKIEPSKKHVVEAVNFRWSQIFDTLAYDNCHFEKEVSFDKAKIGGSVIFDRCRFEEAVGFEGTKIAASVVFNDCVFEKEVNFEGAEVDGFIAFKKCELKKFALFRGAKFPERAVFSDNIFKDGASFSAGTGKSSGSDCLRDEFYHLDFSNSEFRGYLTFNNRKILRSAKFQGAKFYQPPQFQNAELHSGTRFEGAIFHPPNKTMKVEDLLKFSAAYRRLSILLREHGDTRLSTHFHSLDMSATRLSADTSFSERAILTIYWGVSNYGRSISRPFGFLLAVSLCNVAILWLSGLETSESVATVVNETFSPFSGAAWPVGADELSPAIHKLDIIRPSVSAFQGLGVVTSLSLFLFALRRRFD